MLTRLRKFNILVSLHLSQTFDKKRYKDPLQIMKIIFITFFVFLGLFFGFKTFFSIVNEGAHLRLGPDTEFFLSILFVFQIIEFFRIVSRLSSSLYKDEQNKILITFPVNGVLIYMAKLAAFYIETLFRNVLFMLPVLIAYGVFFNSDLIIKFNFWYVLKCLFISFTLPLFMVLLGATLVTPITFISSFLKRSSIISLLLSLLFIAGVITGIYFFIKGLRNKDGIIDQLIFYQNLNFMIREFLPKFNVPSLFIKNIFKLLIATNTKQHFIQYGNIALWFVGLLFSGLLFSMLVYFKLSSYIFEETTKRKYKKRHHVLRIKSQYFIYLTRELKTILRSSETIVSTVLYLSILPITHFFLAFLFKSFNLSPRGELITVIVLFFVGLMVITTSNHLAATIITREGSELYLTKTIPTNIKLMLYSKLTINFFLTFFIIVFDFIVLLSVKLLPSSVVLMVCVLLLLVSIAHIIWSAEIDVLNPEHKKFAETKTLDESKNIKTSMIIGILLSFFLVTIFGFTFKIASPIKSLVPIILIVIFLIIYRVIMFDRKITYYYDEIE